MSKYMQKLDTVGLLLLVGAVVYLSVTNVWDKWVITLAVLGGASIVVGFIANYKQILQTLGKRSTKYFTNSIVSVLLVLALVVGLNFLGQRHAKRFDLTAIGRYTLAPQTQQVLGKLDQDLEIKAFFPGGSYPPLRELLTQFQGESRHVRYEFIDPDRNPSAAKQYDVSRYGTSTNPFTGSAIKFGTAVVLYGGRQEKIEKTSEEIREEDLTNAIIKVQRTESKTVYFVQGHGEKDPGNSERGGYASAKAGLEDEGYRVESLNLAGEARVPDDAKVLVFAGPQNEPFPMEYEFLNEFLNRGGGALVMIDPPPAASMAAFLKDWQITPEDDIILDVSNAGRLLGADPSIPLVLSYQPQAITSRMNRQMTFFPLARSIKSSSESVSGFTLETLFDSSNDSWGETNVKQTEAEFDEKTDLKGPLPLAVAVTKEVKPASEEQAAVSARMVVVGDSDFASIPYFDAQGNGNLFLNMVGWLAQEEDLISIRPKAPEDRKVIMSQGQARMLEILTLVILPGTVLVCGIIVWTRRRR